MGVLATRGRDWPTWAIAAFIVWLPLQTPLALVLHQYGGLPTEAARALLLVKDVAAIAIIGALLPLARAGFRWILPDRLAAGYVAVIAIYAVVPRLAGDPAPLSAVLASARELLLPVELYAMGRLAAAAGAQVERLARTVLWAGLGAAAFAIVTIAFVPPTFWATTLDMVSFIRDVQGIPGRRMLDDVAIVARYGQDAEFVRAIGPFTHPVGAAGYLVPPLGLALALAGSRFQPNRRTTLLLLGGAALLAVAILATISRAGWAAAAIATLIVAAARGRVVLGLVVVILAAAFVAVVPPFSHAIWSVAAGTDSSTLGHAQTTRDGLELLRENPFGLGVGYWDYLGAAYGSEAAPSETLYIALAVAGGPLALGLFVAWIAALTARLRRSTSWVALGVMAAGAGYMLTAFVNSPLLRFTTAASFWLLVGLVATAGLGTVARQRHAGDAELP